MKTNQKTQSNNATGMSARALADLKKVLEDVLDYERGERRCLKVTLIQPPVRLESQGGCAKALPALVGNPSGNTSECVNPLLSPPIPHSM